jgi:hypothetical protein
MDYCFTFIVHYKGSQDPNFEVLKFMDHHFVFVSTSQSTLHMIVVHCLEFGHLLCFKRHLIYKQQWRQKRYGLLLFLIRFYLFNLFFLMMCCNNRSSFSQLYSSSYRSWISLSFSNYYNFYQFQCYHDYCIFSPAIVASVTHRTSMSPWTHEKEHHGINSYCHIVFSHIRRPSVDHQIYLYNL